jgi:hypothetical protein
MGTEQYWQQEKEKLEMNKANINPLIQQTYEDMKELIPRRNAKALYVDCLEGALYLRQYALSDSLTLDDMSMLICRDVGCELQYCQASMSDPYERPYKDCNGQFSELNKCMAQEQERYKSNSERSMQEQVLYMLEKKKEKYHNILQMNKPLEQELERQYIIKEDIGMTNKI